MISRSSKLWDYSRMSSPEAIAKRQSRTWKLTIYWSAMVPVMMTAQVLLTKLGIDIKLPIAETVALAGVVSAAYLGKRAIQANRQQAGA